MAFSLKSLFRRQGHDPAVDEVYAAIVAQARQPEFYTAAGVPDSPVGRFAMLALHGFLALDRLGREEGARDFSQALFDAMFGDMDRNLREMGVGDLSVGKKITNLAQYFYALAAACRAGLNGEGEGLEAALREYVHAGGAPSAEAVALLAGYLRRGEALLAGQDIGAITGGSIAFPPLLED